MSEQFIKGDRGVAGERGAHGDHGQDGRQGIQGEPGIPGTAGVTGRRGPTILGTDRRLVFLFIYTTLAVTVMYLLLGHQQDEGAAKFTHFERQIIANCQQQDAAYRKVNAFLNQAIKNAQNTKGLTPAQKAQSVAAESALHLPIAKCPPEPR